MPRNYYFTDAGAFPVIKDLTIQESFDDFKADVCFDYIPVSSALEKLSTFFAVLSFQYDHHMIDAKDVSSLAEQCHNLLQLKLDRAKAGLMTKLPQ